MRGCVVRRPFLQQACPLLLACAAPPAHLRRLLDTLPLAKAFVSGCDNHRQSTLRRHYGIALPPGEAEHDAGTDAVVLARLLPHLAQVLQLQKWEGRRARRAAKLGQLQLTSG